MSYDPFLNIDCSCINEGEIIKVEKLPDRFKFKTSAEFSLTILSAFTNCRREKGNHDNLSSTVTGAKWRATNYSINLLTLLQERINHFINSSGMTMNHNMTKATVRPIFKMKTNYKLQEKFETKA